MADRKTGREAAPPRRLKKDRAASAPPTAQAAAPAGAHPKTGNLKVRSHLQKGIAELQRLHGLLLSSEVDPDVLSDFRDALNRVRNTAWAAQQYVVRQESGQESTSVLSILDGERIRAAYQLCQAVTEDLKRADIEFQRGSLVQLYEATKTLTATLKGVIDRL